MLEVVGAQDAADVRVVFGVAVVFVVEDGATEGVVAGGGVGEEVGEVGGHGVCGERGERVSVLKRMVSVKESLLPEAYFHYCLRHTESQVSLGYGV